MELQRNYIVYSQPTAPNLHTSDPLTSSTSLLGDVPPSNLPKTHGITTAAIVRSTTSPGADIVIYETVDNQQV